MTDLLPELTGNGHYSVPDFGPRWIVGKAANKRALGSGVNLMEEYGRTGLRHWGGFVFEEWLRELSQGRRAAEVYREMADSDPVIGGMLYAIEMLIRRVSWWVDPASSSLTDKKNAAWFESNMNDMDVSWVDTIAEITGFLQYGWCLPPDQTVLDGTGRPREIQDVRTGDLVLTREGRARRVNHVFIRPFSGELVSIKMRGYPHRIRLTPEHRLPTEAGWTTAGELCKGDVLLRPLLGLADGGSYDDGWLIGAYLAEGNRDRGRNRVNFSVHTSEVDELASRVDAWAESRNLEYAMTTHRVQFGKPRASRMYAEDLGKESQGGRVAFSHEDFRDFIDEWVGGDNAWDKCLRKLPEERDLAEGMLAGWAWGDGSDAMQGGYQVKGASSVSEDLSQQMQLIAGSLGLPSPLWRRRGGHLSQLRDESVLTPPNYVVGLLPERWVTPKRNPELEAFALRLLSEGNTLQMVSARTGVTMNTLVRWRKNPEPAQPFRQGLQLSVMDDYIGHPIIEVTREPFEGSVYDLEVEEDHTFCAGPIAVSNSYHEMVFKVRNGYKPGDPVNSSMIDDGTIGLAKLPVRAQDTLWKWVFTPEGEVEGFIQNPPPDYLLRYIPLPKALLFRTKVTKGNPEGRSVLRSAYRAYYFCRNLQSVEGIGAERDLAGLPILQAPEGVDIWDTNDPAMVGLKTAAQNVVSSIRRDEQEGVILPSGWTLQLLSTGGRRQFNVGEIITRYEQRIATSILLDVILLGQDKVGSYALAGVKKGLFTASLEAYLDQIAEEFNAHCIPTLFAINGFPTDKGFPRLKHGRVEAVDLETLGDYVQKLAMGGAPLFPNEELLAHLLGEAGLPTAMALENNASLARNDQTYAAEEAASAQASRTQAAPRAMARAVGGSRPVRSAQAAGAASVGAAQR